MPFTTSKAKSILTNEIKANTTYVGLFTTPPTEAGSGFAEPGTETGYVRKLIGALDTSKDRQIANDDVIFFYEAVADCGTLTHFGLFNTSTGGAPFFYGPLVEPIEVTTGKVPLIRRHELVVGLDKDELDTYST